MFKLCGEENKRARRERRDHPCYVIHNFKVQKGGIILSVFLLCCGNAEVEFSLLALSSIRFQSEMKLIEKVKENQANQSLAISCESTRHYVAAKGRRSMMNCLRFRVDDVDRCINLFAIISGYQFLLLETAEAEEDVDIERRTTSARRRRKNKQREDYNGSR